MGRKYAEIVDKDRIISFACPTAYDGVLKDGRDFVFRYRYGIASLKVAVKPGDDPSKGSMASLSHGSEMSGILDEDEYREMFERLFDALHPLD